jgi:hypothetical protein
MLKDKIEKKKLIIQKNKIEPTKVNHQTNRSSYEIG